MRKRNIKCLFDTFFWYLVYMLPVIVMLFCTFRTGQPIAMSTVLSDLHLDFAVNSTVVDFLMDLFGTGGVVPLFANPDMLLFLSYFVTMIMLHCVVDVVAFIPRLAHSWIDKYSKKEID